jgi:site-specific recombinase XerC
MHLLQSGVPLITIKDVLGHADIKSTEVYVQADLEMKRKALQSVGTPSRVPRGKLKASSDLLTWLDTL